MCGISMILDFTGTVHSEHIQKMMDVSRHRGPDARAYIGRSFGDGALLLGSNRLQIIDRENHSNQPFTSDDGRYQLVFNGEIYNSEELRNQLLSLGVQFSTLSDTEVLLHWLIKKGAKGINELNGMFAFVFVDLSKNQLLIARDSTGIKPLFVSHSEKQLILSSEIQGLHSSGLVPKELNEDAIPYYLAYKYAPRPATFYKHVFELMPGDVWQLDKKGKAQKSKIVLKKQAPSQPIRELLIDAVVQQYSAANNTGVMLSGGVDSTLLLAILNKELGYRNIPVYTVVTKGKNNFATQDGSFAARAARQYQAEFNEIGIDETCIEELDAYIRSIGQPIADSGGFLTWVIAKAAKDKSKVLLSGAGADELFAGYNRHNAFNLYLKHRNKSWFNFLKQGKKLPPSFPFLAQLNKLASSIDVDPSSTFNNFIQSDSFRMNKKLWDGNDNYETHLRKALEHDQQHYLGADVLAITDHSTMQHAVEARVPYLDNQLIVATRNMPANYLLKNGGKWLLKEALVSYDGKQFANRKKQGLGLPMNDWFRNNKQWFDFNNTHSIIHQFVSKQKIESLLKMHNSRNKDLTQELWRILLLHKWLSHNFT